MPTETIKIECPACGEVMSIYSLTGTAEELAAWRERCAGQQTSGCCGRTVRIDGAGKVFEVEVVKEAPADAPAPEGS